MPNLSNKISPNCFGEFTLNSSPASSNTRFSCCLIRSSNKLERFSKSDRLTWTPSFSIRIKTGTRGRSTVSYNTLTPWFSSESIRSLKILYSCRVMSASSAAYGVASLIAISSNVFCFLPVPATSLKEIHVCPKCSSARSSIPWPCKPPSKQADISIVSSKPFIWRPSLLKICISYLRFWPIFVYVSSSKYGFNFSNTYDLSSCSISVESISTLWVRGI